MFEELQFISIFLEAIIAVIGLMIVFKKKKNYGIGIFTTFMVYVFYDLARVLKFSVLEGSLYSMFFIATLSMLLSVYVIYLEKKSQQKIK